MTRLSTIVQNARWSLFRAICPQTGNLYTQVFAQSVKGETEEFNGFLSRLIISNETMTIHRETQLIKHPSTQASQ